MCIRDRRWPVVRLWFKIIAACVPAAVLGILLDDWMDAHLYNSVVVALAKEVVKDYFGTQYFTIVRGQMTGVAPKPAAEVTNALLQACLLYTSFRHWRRSPLQHPVLSALLAWPLPHLARRIGT